MKAIEIDGKKYVPVDERIRELHRRGLDFSLTSEYEFIPMHNMFVVTAAMIINHPTECYRSFTGIASKIYNVGTFNSAAVSWAETIARGRAIGVYLAPALAEIGAELVSAEEVHKEDNSSVATSTLTDGALNALKNKKQGGSVCR